MAPNQPEVVKDYYRRVKAQDFLEVARELIPERIIHEGERKILCDCPNHDSKSGRSLEIDLDKQLWICRGGCGVGGDLIHFVEFVQSGVVTKQQPVGMSETHRRARDFLAVRAGMPLLAQQSLSEEEIKKLEADAAETQRIRGALTKLADFYHQLLLARPEVMDWLKSKYAVTDEVIADMKIGFAAEAPAAMRLLMEGEDGLTREELIATGCFISPPSASGAIYPFFADRITFPYWHQGQVVYLIGRQTRWTPDKPWEKAKYKKLPTHDPKNHPEIALCITNDHLLNEGCLDRRADSVVISEGITDCIAAMARGVRAISPATIRIRQEDLPRLATKLTRAKNVYLCNDNEIPPTGLNAALETAASFAEHGIAVKIIQLPVLEPARAARDLLEALVGKEALRDKRALDQKKSLLDEAGQAEVKTLLAAAKVDLNDFFLSGATFQMFEALMQGAQSALEIKVRLLPADLPEEERNRQIGPLLEAIAALDPLEQERYHRVVVEHFEGDAAFRKALVQQLKLITKRMKDAAAANAKVNAHAEEVQTGSCRHAMQFALQVPSGRPGPHEYDLAALAAFHWMVAAGARFFKTSEGEPFMFYQDQIYWVDIPDRNRRREFRSMMHDLTGMVTTTVEGRTFYEAFANLAIKHGKVKATLSWIHSDDKTNTVYFNLNNERNEIVKISPEGVELLKNGGNPDGILLAKSSKLKPIRYLPDADPAQADSLLKELFIDKLTCPLPDRYFILEWVSCFLLLDFVSIKPLMRFEGKEGSAKTTGSKLLSTIVFGEPKEKTGTNASNYSDGSQNPVVFLDNVESREMTPELLNFMINSASGNSKEKRKSGTDTENVSERTKCLILSTGIEPLGGNAGEILTRLFLVRFSIENSKDDCFVETEVIAKLKEARDLILSALFKRTSQVLALYRGGAHKRVMPQLQKLLGSHGKRRCNDYLALMYLHLIAGEPPEGVEEALTSLRPGFLDQIRSTNLLAADTAKESSHIATVMVALFRGYQKALEADDAIDPSHRSKSLAKEYEARFLLDFGDEGEIRGVLAKELFTALSRLARDFGLQFPYQNTQQFIQRLNNSLKTLEETGIKIVHHDHAGRTRRYDISYQPPESSADEGNKAKEDDADEQKKSTTSIIH